MTNYIFLISALLITLTSCEQSKETTQKVYPAHVGDYDFNSPTDSSDPAPCHSDLIYQYYNFGDGLSIKGEKDYIDNHFLSRFKKYKAENSSGYITIRFIVTCDGETCCFSVEEMGVDYKPKEFNKSLSDQLLSLTKEIKGWEIGELEGQKMDYYQYLSFKILDGELVEISP